MTNQINDGGPAFPSPPSQHSNGFYSTGNGMTLRDYFAAKAMQAIISSALNEQTKTGYNINNPHFLECLSLDAYAHADAMLKVREAK